MMVHEKAGSAAWSGRGHWACKGSPAGHDDSIIADLLPDCNKIKFATF